MKHRIHFYFGGKIASKDLNKIITETYSKTPQSLNPLTEHSADILQRNPDLVIGAGMVQELVPKNYSKTNQDIFAMLTIKGNYKLLGSGAIQGVLYKNDYDLMELASYDKNKSHIQQLLKIFQNKFKNILSHPNWYITDFKCGEYNNEPLRWSKEDVKRGFKNINNKKILFTDCILQKATMKLDLAVFIDGVFNEYTENYYIKIGDETNYEKDKLLKENILVDISKSAIEQFEEGNLLKYLKRIFSYLQIANKKKQLQNKLIDFFNTEIGLIYKCKSNLELLILMMEQKFKPVPIDDVKYNLQNLKQILFNIVGLDASKIFKIDNICNLSSKPKMKTGIKKLLDYLLLIVNKNTDKFIKKNKQLNKIFL
jgi:hypothetical protein